MAFSPRGFSLPYGHCGHLEILFRSIITRSAAAAWSQAGQREEEGTPAGGCLFTDPSGHFGVTANKTIVSPHLIVLHSTRPAAPYLRSVGYAPIGCTFAKRNTNKKVGVGLENIQAQSEAESPGHFYFLCSSPSRSWSKYRSFYLDLFLIWGEVPLITTNGTQVDVHFVPKGDGPVPASALFHSQVSLVHTCPQTALWRRLFPK